MSSWISIADSLPEPNTTVLACRVGKTSYPPFMAVRKNRDKKPLEYLSGDTCHTRITHWFPIPEMPK